MDDLPVDDRDAREIQQTRYVTHETIPGEPNLQHVVLRTVESVEHIGDATANPHPQDSGVVAKLTAHPGISALVAGFAAGMALAAFLIATHDGFSTPVEAFAIYLPPVLGAAVASLTYWMLRCLEGRHGGRPVAPASEVVLLAFPALVVRTLAGWATFHDTLPLLITIAFVVLCSVAGRVLSRPDLG